MKPAHIALNLTIAALGALVSTAPAAVYTDGHGDFGVAFEDDTEWFVHYHFDTTAVIDGSLLTEEAELDPATVIIQLSDSAKVNLPVPLSFLGANPGDDIWLIPQNQETGVPFFGLATEELDASWGNITFALSSFSGPGNFALWTNGIFGEAQVKMQTNNGVDGAIDREILTSGTHAHYNWGFTAPGTYELELTVSSTHPTFGAQSDTQTITVEVIPEPGSALLLALGAAFVVTHRARRIAALA